MNAFIQFLLGVSIGIVLALPGLWLAPKVGDWVLDKLEPPMNFYGALAIASVAYIFGYVIGITPGGLLTLWILQKLGAL